MSARDLDVTSLSYIHGVLVNVIIKLLKLLGLVPGPRE